MISIKCKECGCIDEVDEEKVKEDYLQCPYCGRIIKNPL